MSVSNTYLITESKPLPQHHKTIDVIISLSTNHPHKEWLVDQDCEVLAIYTTSTDSREG